MDNQKFTELLARISDGSADEQDIALYLKWYKQAGSGARSADLDTSGIKSELFEKIQGRIKDDIAPAGSIRRLWPRIAAAACLLCGVLAGGYYFLRSPAPVQSIAQHTSPRIIPGTNKAILILANGKQIILDNTSKGRLAVEGATTVDKANEGELVYRSESTATKNAVSEMNTIRTPRGGQYMVVLPDGSNVYLNAASTLTYPVAFTGVERHVILTGEAYFEIAKDPKHPFKVETPQRQVIEVLGTHFNVKAYDDETQIKTTLLEGSVRLTADTKLMLLKPGETAINEDGQLSINKADIDQVMGWKNGLFVFKKQSIRDLLREASRWYDVEIEYRGSAGKKKLWGVVARNKPITELLNNIAFTSGIHYKIEGRKIILMD